MVYDILIADDEPAIAEATELTLMMEGYSTLLATNGQEACQKAMQHTPQLVLLDVMMPEMDGYQVLAWLREQPALSRVRVVMLSARSQEQDRQRGLKLGADDYLVKPFRHDELMQSVRKYVTKG